MFTLMVSCNNIRAPKGTKSINIVSATHPAKFLYLKLLQEHGYKYDISHFGSEEHWWAVKEKKEDNPNGYIILVEEGNTLKI